MSRWIDADELQGKAYTLCFRHRISERELALINYLIEVEPIGRMPKDSSIDIVRCKECKFNYGNEHNCEYNLEDIVCTYHASDGFHANDFCSYGERRE